MTRPYSVAFKQKMVQRLTGKDAVSATQLARETGIRQQNLSRRLEEARSLPLVASEKPAARVCGPSSRRLGSWPKPPSSVGSSSPPFSNARV
jgi:transposase-like protein